MPAMKEVSDIKVFFSVNIFIIKQSKLLLFLGLLRIVSSDDWKHKKRDYTEFIPKFFRELTMGF